MNSKLINCPRFDILKHESEDFTELGNDNVKLWGNKFKVQARSIIFYMPSRIFGHLSAFTGSC